MGAAWWDLLVRSVPARKEAIAPVLEGPREDQRIPPSGSLLSGRLFGGHLVRPRQHPLVRKSYIYTILFFLVIFHYMIDTKMDLSTLTPLF